MILCTTILLTIAALCIGCNPQEKEREQEQKFHEFQKERETTIVGVDVDVLRSALALYPQFKQQNASGQLDIMKLREFTSQREMNTVEFIPVFMVIKEIEDSSRTEAGDVAIRKKYSPRVVDLVQTTLGIKRK